MRATILVLVSIFLLSGCGDDGKAQKKVKLKGLKEQYKVLNAEKAEKGPAWQAVKNKVIPAQKAYKRAKRGDDESATAMAKQAFDEASAASDEVIKLEEALSIRIRDLRDEIRRLGGKP